MKGYAMLKIGESGWIEEERPVCGLLMRFAALSRLPSVLPMFTPYGPEPLANGTT